MLTPVRAPPPGRAGYGCSHRPLVGRVRPTRPGPSPYPYPVARALSLLTTVCARVIPPGLERHNLGCGDHNTRTCKRRHHAHRTQRKHDAHTRTHAAPPRAAPARRSPSSPRRVVPPPSAPPAAAPPPARALPPRLPPPVASSSRAIECTPSSPRAVPPLQRALSFPDAALSPLPCRRRVVPAPCCSVVFVFSSCSLCVTFW